MTQPTRTREIAIAEWCGYTEIAIADGLVFGRRPDGKTTEIPHYFTSRFAILDAMEAVKARGLSNRLRNYVRGVVWTDGSGRDVDNPTDGQRAEALARMVVGELDGRLA